MQRTTNSSSDHAVSGEEHSCTKLKENYSVAIITIMNTRKSKSHAQIKPSVETYLLLLLLANQHNLIPLKTPSHYYPLHICCVIDGWLSLLQLLIVIVS